MSKKILNKNDLWFEIRYGGAVVALANDSDVAQSLFNDFIHDGTFRYPELLTAVCCYSDGFECEPLFVTRLTRKEWSARRCAFLR